MPSLRLQVQGTAESQAPKNTLEVLSKQLTIAITMWEHHLDFWEHTLPSARTPPAQYHLSPAMSKGIESMGCDMRSGGKSTRVGWGS